MPLLTGLKERVEAVKEQAAASRYEGQAGGGLVRVTCTGGMELTALEIGPTVQVATDADRALLEDLIRAATNDALRKAREGLREGLSDVAGGLPIPPGLLGL
jgi:DNA-binding YbaB/EbfC family protein